MPELVDLVNAKDKVIGKTTKEEAHVKGSLHRAVHVFVFNKQGKLFLQKRSKKKLLAPGLWDSSVGEHLKAGESYEKAALRGLKEELSIRKKLKLEKLFKGRFADKQSNYYNREIVGVFKTVFDRKIIISKESEEGKFFTIEKIKDLIANKPEIFCKWFIKFFKKTLKMKHYAKQKERFSAGNC